MLEADAAKGRMSSGHTNSEPEIVTSFPPALSQDLDAFAHLERHHYCALSMIPLWEWIVEEHQHSIPNKTLEGALVSHHKVAHGGMILSENGNHLLRLCCLSEAREPAQISENDCNIAPVTLQGIQASPPGNYEICHLGGQKPAQAAHPCDLLDLFGYPLFQHPVPFGEFSCLALDRVVQCLNAQHGSDPRQQCSMIDRFSQVVIAARIEALDHVSGV
jgi:hypothetical protein